MTHMHTDTGGGAATGAILGMLVAIVAILLIAVFAFGAFGWRDGGGGGLEGGGGVDTNLPAPGDGNNGGDAPATPMNWHASYDALTFV